MRLFLLLFMYTTDIKLFFHIEFFRYLFYFTCIIGSTIIIVVTFDIKPYHVHTNTRKHNIRYKSFFVYLVAALLLVIKTMAFTFIHPKNVYNTDITLWVFTWFSCWFISCQNIGLFIFIHTYNNLIYKTRVNSRTSIGFQTIGQLLCIS